MRGAPEWTYELAEKVLIESIGYPTVLGESYKEIVEYYAEVLRKHGLHVSVHRVPREYVELHLSAEQRPERERYILLARAGRGERVLQFNGHYDVVSPGEGWSITEPFKPRKVNDRVYGRGATDMKGGIAAFVAAVAYLAELEGLDIVVEAAIVPDEEIGGAAGTGYLVDVMNSRPSWALIAEPSGLENIWIGHRGLVWGYVKTRGVQVHGSTPWLGDNAFEKLVLVAKRFLDEYVPSLRNKRSGYAYDVPGSEHPSVTIGGKLISPGSINVVPGVSGFSVDRRLIVEERADDVVREIEAFVEAASRDFGFGVEFEVVEKMDPALTEPSSPLVSALSRVAAKYIDREPSRAVCVGGLDLRYYSRRGVEAVAYGPGVPLMAHRVDEYVELKSLYRAVDIYVELALELSRASI